jgi:hypothetical protein
MPLRGSRYGLLFCLEVLVQQPRQELRQSRNSKHLINEVYLVIELPSKVITASLLSISCWSVS